MNPKAERIATYYKKGHERPPEVGHFDTFNVVEKIFHLLPYAGLWLLLKTPYQRFEVAQVSLRHEEWMSQPPRALPGWSQTSEESSRHRGAGYGAPTGPGPFWDRRKSGLPLARR